MVDEKKSEGEKTLGYYQTPNGEVYGIVEHDDGVEIKGHRLKRHYPIRSSVKHLRPGVPVTPAVVRRIRTKKR